MTTTKFKYPLNIQRFAAETNFTGKSDLEPAISIDFTSHLTENINDLLKVLSVNEAIPMAVGQVIKRYKCRIKTKPTTKAGEGETIPLTRVERVALDPIEIAFDKYRKATSAEAIQKIGRDKAIIQTDAEIVKMIQKDIKASFFTYLKDGTGTATPKEVGLQGGLAAAWGVIQAKFEDIDATPIYFVNPSDIADYLAKATVSTQTAFGFTYIQNFLGLGDVFVSPQVEAGKIFATAKENLNMAYIPASNSDIASVFGLTSDETGLIGMTHTPKTDNATIETLLIAGVKFFAEEVDKVIKVTLKTETVSEPDTPSVTQPAE